MEVPVTEAWKSLLREAADPARLVRLSRRSRRLLKQQGPPPEAVALPLALLGGATLDLLAPALELALLQRGVAPAIHRPAYGTWQQELLDPESPTSQAAPKLAVLVLSGSDIPEWPAPGASAEEAEAVAERVLQWLVGPCAVLHVRRGTEFILSTFPVTGQDTHGSLGARLPHDRNNFLRRLNQRLGDRAPEFVHLFDAAQLANEMGTAKFFDARLWYEAKLPLTLEATGPFAAGVAAVTAALLGLSRKCLVLDLDDTLWGGVIGDAGLEGIELGEGNARGEAFKAFQQYVKELRERGVLLAVCSKNEQSNAELPFEKHPETVLRLDDFVAFRANWNAKSENIRAIARELDLPPSALVFADDNPAECEQVRQALPEVGIVELPEDPADYPRALASGRWFESVAVTDDDRKRHEQYRSRAAARRLSEEADDLSDFLASLEMRAEVDPIGSSSLVRATQLINKTNQFNLTTRRLTQSEVQGIAGDPAHIHFVVRLADRFGDHGLVALVTGHCEGHSLRIDDWLMSCRVLKRGVERYMLNELVKRARDRGVEELRARFVPTGRNELVRGLYPELGFSLTGEAADACEYTLKMSEAAPLDHFINAKSEEASSS
jgi:FkbH-like protein